ncbi:uncharacterized protein LOC121864082 isoform X1 [Homarus americanus]|uniref:uncharacterized protein LOC121864082 isoform X1 n=1 Tax=Homarus americanus TaxID=6706 RepID=UPI001C478BF3|nr:uncharacterized protein LOC121864082 isoform X1 [Homarus americanus]
MPQPPRRCYTYLKYMMTPPMGILPKERVYRDPLEPFLCNLFSTFTYNTTSQRTLARGEMFVVDYSTVQDLLPCSFNIVNEECFKYENWEDKEAPQLLCTLTQCKPLQSPLCCK